MLPPPCLFPISNHLWFSFRMMNHHVFVVAPQQQHPAFLGKHTVFFGEHFFDGDSWISGGCGFADNWELGCVKKPVILVMDYMED